MLLCMRTTIRLDEDLLTQVKATAARTGRTLTSFVEDALRQAMARTEAQAATKPYRVKGFRGGLRPGVNLDSNADTLDLMEGL